MLTVVKVLRSHLWRTSEGSDGIFSFKTWKTSRLEAGYST